MRADQIPLSRGLFGRLAELGLDVPATLQRAGLPVDLPQRPPPMLSTAQFFALWQAAAEVNADPGFGLRLGDQVRRLDHDLVLLSALHSANLGEALLKLSRYKRLTCPEELSLEERGDEATLSLRWMLSANHPPPLLIDSTCAAMLALAERGSGRALRLKRLELTRRPAQAELLAAHFRCELRFNAPRDVLVFQRADLALPFVSRDDDRMAALLPELEAALREQSASMPLRDKAWNALARGMRGGRLRMAQVADALHLSTRTLQRRLGESGTSYQQLLDDVRRHLARHLLDATDLHPGEIAFLLGFEELNSFHRAFRQWEGKTPARWRATG